MIGVIISMYFKKINSILLIFIILSALLFSSCSEETSEPTESPTDILAKIVSNFPDIPIAKATYFDGADILDLGYLDPEYAGFMYMGEYIENFTELDKLESYAIRIPDGKSVFEIHILKVRNLSDVESIADMCRTRVNILKTGDIAGYDPELFYTIIEKAEVYTVGRYVFLLSTTDNDAAKEIING